MHELRTLAQIGGADRGWLRAKHHFAIGPYGNPAHRALGPLYVWNDDEIAPRTGFGLHGHANVEIVTYVREGVLTHEDDLGNIGHLQAGQVQVISAGTGIRHAERNDQADAVTRIFQIWLHPRRRGAAPSWNTRAFPALQRAGRFVPLASGEDLPDALALDADATVYGATLAANTTTIVELKPMQGAYLVPTRGQLIVNGTPVHTGEGLLIRDEAAIAVVAQTDAEVVLVVTALDAHEA